MAHVNRFGALFEHRISENFDQRLERWVRVRVPNAQVEGFCSEVLCRALSFIRKRGTASIREPEAWIFGIAHHLAQERSRAARSRELAQRELIGREKQHEDLNLKDALAGESTLKDRPTEWTMRLVRAAMENLPPRHREFLEFDLGECLSPEEIRLRMGIRSYAYFKKLKCMALKTLREEILRLIKGGGDR